MLRQDSWALLQGGEMRLQGVSPNLDWRQAEAGEACREVRVPCAERCGVAGVPQP